MGGLIVQVMMPVVLTHGFRWLGRRVGPRRGALLLGLPTTSAVVLYGFGAERGPVEALGAAEASLLGLVAAALTPVVYARFSRSGWGLPGVPIAAAIGYLLVATALGGLSGSGPAVAVGVASLGLALAVCLANRDEDSPVDVEIENIEKMNRNRWRWGLLAIRTVVPVVMALGVRVLRDLGGPSAAGLFLTFPATSLSLLITTQIEGGPVAARSLARAMPPGALGMAAFLSMFLVLTPTFGSLVATLFGYLAALGALGIAEACASRNLSALVLRTRRRILRRVKIVIQSLIHDWEELARWCRGGVRPHRSTRFSPLVEALAG